MNSCDSYELIIGLEIHVQLLTLSKLFCGCSTKFGSPPNTQTCEVCTGMPGALPVLNDRALKLAIKTGLALNCKIEPQTKWDRKNYFYPDLPKGYQISQYDKPICFDGFLEVVDANGHATGDRIRIERAHLEEDAGKSIHDDSRKGGNTRIDLNRAGTPLLEIVTRPDLTSAEQAKNFLTELKLILTYIEVSDCNMQQGNLRVDANVNLAIDREKKAFTPIVEVKNLNSFRAVERAINFEADRQYSEFQTTGKTKDNAPKQTRGWDDSKQETVLQREKEDSADYRYFPDPDLVAIETSKSTIVEQQSELGKLPGQIREEFMNRFELPAYDANVLARQGRAAVQFFYEAEGAVGNPKLVSNWIQQEVLRHLNETGLKIENYPVSASQFSHLLNEVSCKRIDPSRAKDVLNLMVSKKLDFETSKEKLGIVEIDASQIEQICETLIAENPNVIADFRNGNTKAIGSLIGQARRINASVNPKLVRQKLLKILNS